MIPHFYDEFGTYTTKEDIEIYIENLIGLGETDDKIVYNKCIFMFGDMLSDIINEVLYED
jgi:hypothetical protein